MTKETIVASPIGVAGEYPGQQAKLTKGGIHVFTSLKERNAMWPLLKDDNTIALVGIGDNGYPSWYKWENNKWNFEGYFGGMVLADTDGALTRVDSTAVFGPDFQIQAAGDTGNGILIVLSDEVKNELAKKTSAAVAFKTGPYLELNQEKDGNVLEIKPGSFELRKTPGYLAYLQYSEVVTGKNIESNKYHRGAIWPDMIRVSPEGLLQIDRDAKAIGLQETDNKDPNITGGSKFLVWPFIYLEGNAPTDGYVELLWYKKSDNTIAVDVNGHPLAVRHHYSAGQELTPKHAPLMLAQVMAVKGLTEYGLALVDSFGDDVIKILDYVEGPSGICIQELSKDGVSSPALLQAEVDTGFNVRVENFYTGTYLSSIGFALGVNEPTTKQDAGTKANSVAGVELYAVTDSDWTISQGMLQVSGYNGGIADFYIGLELDRETTRILAGEQLEAALSLVDKDDGWTVGFFNYTGDFSKRPPIYSSRSNGDIVLNSGWTKFGSDFISEDVVSGLHSHQTPGIVIPKNADQVMVAIYPVSAQSPCDINLKAFHLDAVNPAEHFAVNSIDITGLQHLDFMTNTVKMSQGLGVVNAMTGKRENDFAALRYTDGDKAGGLPMPFGTPQGKLQYLTLDKSLNAVAGSSADGGEGGLLASEHVEVTISQKWQLYNEQAAAHTAEYWLMKYTDSTGQSTEVPSSRTEFTVDSKRAGVDYFSTNEVTVTLEPGDYIYVRCNSDVADGAYAQTNQASKPLCITYITEKYLG